MEMEKAKENGAKIFCIYFQNKDSNYDFGKIKGKSLENEDYSSFFLM